MSAKANELSDVVRNWITPYTPGLLTEEELDQFFLEGYVVKHDLFTKEELQPAITELENSVDNLANMLFKAGKIKDKCKDSGFYHRLIRLEKQFPDAPVLLLKTEVFPPAFCALNGHPKLLSIAKQIIGPEVGAHPVWNLRSKTPKKEETVVPWHQDAAYMSKDCWKDLQLTAWIPLIDATTKNGCMQMVPGGHKSGKVITHTGCPGETWYIEIPPGAAVKEVDIDMDKHAVTCEMKMGSVLLFNSLLPHRSVPNTSTDTRWSLDLRLCNPKLPTGVFGMKESLPLCTGGKDLSPDWEKWANLGRTSLQNEYVSSGAVSKDDELDATICGPWMYQWEMTHHNKHTARLSVK
ncbi:hypothetical protein LOD99_2292 [Oopsacas minuta]|uniref:Phytanoyl-CoA dioxygenase family protein n=1 Tax=Oopsacas minuta TaxID=111878 RepID=A0AAV7K1A1_9METZ|nr:hypothetical protein LOD99_2292 [Oopsacas minuta]